MSYEWWVAKRYLWSKRRHPFVGVMSAISIAGIAVGVAALIVVLAVMNGFDEDLKDRIIGTRAHLTIQKDGLFDNYAPILLGLNRFSAVKGAAPFVEGQALIQHDDRAGGVLLRGVDVRGERSVSRFFDFIVKGTLSEKPGGIVVGSELAKHFHLDVGSTVLVLTQNLQKPAGCRVEGIFTSGMYEYDANLIFMNLQNAQNIFEMGPGVSGISVYLKDAEKAGQFRKALAAKLGFGYDVRTWMDMNRTLFSALKLEKTVMFLILALIVLVACLNIAGSLTILVMDKTRDIGVLKAMGTTPSSVRAIFAADGLLVGCAGAAAGFLIGVAICFILKKYSFVELPKEVYYIDKLPVRMNWRDTMAVLSVAVGLSWLSALYPASVAGRLNPAQALRYE